jgi:hypothetical protein
VQVTLGLYPDEVERIATALGFIARDHLDRMQQKMLEGEVTFPLAVTDAIAKSHSHAAAWQTLADAMESTRLAPSLELEEVE